MSFARGWETDVGHEEDSATFLTNLMERLQARNLRVKSDSTVFSRSGSTYRPDLMVTSESGDTVILIEVKGPSVSEQDSVSWEPLARLRDAADDVSEAHGHRAEPVFVAIGRKFSRSAHEFAREKRMEGNLLELVNADDIDSAVARIVERSV